MVGLVSLLTQILGQLECSSFSLNQMTGRSLGNRQKSASVLGPHPAGPCRCTHSAAAALIMPHLPLLRLLCLVHR